MPRHYLPLLILAAESIFILPFVLPRVFRPTVLAAYRIDNTQLGYCFAAYGFVALAAYLLGGPLADRYPARYLLAGSLLATAAGGVYAATFPGYAGLKWLYGYWGLTTILLAWAPMIKATRVWGGAERQGRAYGWLDGGRGLVGALFGLAGVGVFALVGGGGVDGGDGIVERASFRNVLLVCSGLIAVVGLLVARYLTVEDRGEEEVTVDRITPALLGRVLRLPAVWLLMLIIACAYTGYKVTDVFSQYANEVLGYDREISAWVGSALQFLRPAVGITVGFLAPRTNLARWLLGSFLLSIVGSLGLALVPAEVTPLLLFVVSTTLIGTGVYAARGLYFAVMREGHISLALTGTAVGLISLVGYTPDIYAGVLIGQLLDGFPGPAGFRYVFWVTAGFSLLGALATAYYHHRFAADSPQDYGSSPTLL